jgi:hypothetical protein
MKNLKNVLVILTLFIYIYPVKAEPTGNHEESPSIIYIGDSNLWIGGDDCQKEKGWSYHYNRMTDSRGVSYARSGATWTNTINTVADTSYYSEVLSDNNVIYNQVLRLEEDYRNGKYQKSPEVIFISAGTNDAWFKDKREGIFSKTCEEALSEDNEIMNKKLSELCSLAESVYRVLLELNREFPNSKKVLLTPPPTTATSIANIKHVSDIIDLCGKMAGEMVIRLDDDQHIDTYDGTHTTAIGARHIANVVYNHLTSEY